MGKKKFTQEFIDQTHKDTMKYISTLSTEDSPNIFLGFNPNHNYTPLLDLLQNTRRRNFNENPKMFQEISTPSIFRKLIIKTLMKLLSLTKEEQ